MSETKNLKLFKHDEPLETNENQFDIKKSLHDNWDKLDEFAGKVNTKTAEIENKQKQHDTDISNIKQEQQDQNSKIENNTVENKEQADLLNQIVNIFPTATGEGEYVTLDNTAEARFKKFQVQGNSKQETRSGKNAIKGFYRRTARTITWYIDKNKLEKTMYFSLIASKELSKTNTIFFNAIDGSLTAINKSAMVIKANEKSIRQIDFTEEELNTLKNSDKDIILQIYENNTEIDYTTITFSEVMLANSNNTDYEQYGASPSPEYPSKIRNVGDDVNLFNKDENVIISVDTEKTPIETGAKVTVKAKGAAKYCVMKLGGSELLGKTFILHGEARFSGKNDGLIGLYFGTESNFNIQWITDTNYLTIESSKFKRVFTVPDTFPEGSDTIYILLYANSRSTEAKVGDYVEYRDLKIKEGTQATAYSPYGCSNTEVIVCNKNVANLNIVDTQFRAKTEKINNNTFKVTNTSVEATAYGQVEMYLQKNKQYTIFMQAEGKDIENAKISIMKDYNGKGYIKADITNYFTFTTEQEKLVILMYPTNKGNLQGLETIFKIMIVEGNNTQQEYNDNEQQSILFPFTEGQRLYKGDYLAEDGIHHTRKKIVLDGTERWQLGSSGNNLINQRFYLANNDIKPNGAILCNYFKEMYRGSLQITVEDIEACNISNGRYIQIKINKKIASTVDEFKNWIKQKKNEGNPLTFECELDKEEVEPYTQKQQEAYNQQKKLHSYNEQTNIFSKDEISPVFNVEAIKNLNATFAQLSATML